MSVYSDCLSGKVTCVECDYRSFDDYGNFQCKFKTVLSEDLVKGKKQVRNCKNCKHWNKYYEFCFQTKDKVKDCWDKDYALFTSKYVPSVWDSVIYTDLNGIKHKGIVVDETDYTFNVLFLNRSTSWVEKQYCVRTGNSYKELEVIFTELGNDRNKL